MDERERRLAENEALFRAVNERIEERAVALGDDGHVYEFFCECSNPECTFRIRATLVEYERVRADPARFVVKPGHDLPEVERVVVRDDAYWVVEKEDEAAEHAARLDPRSGAD